jgi:crotonobetainyl-CoA:carnitine CoA-transferase CaiB-like acyl-CoA transferase
MFALFAQRNERSEAFNKGQVIDLAIIEPILAILGPQATVYDQLKIVQPRTGNRSVNNSPRNTYMTKDGKWLAVSTSAQSIAERVLTLVGHPEVIKEPWFTTGSTRAEHSVILDKYVGDWIAARDSELVIKAFEEAEAAVAPIYDIRDILTDPQFIALKTILDVQDPELGTLKMQNVMYRMSGTPGEIKWTGRPKGADSRQILQSELKLTKDQIDKLIEIGVVGVNE